MKVLLYTALLLFVAASTSCKSQNKKNAAAPLAAPVQQNNISFPAPAGCVNDFAGILSPGQKDSLTAKIDSFEKKTTNEISIVTVETIRPDSIETYARQLFNNRGLGKKDKNNGVLILVAYKDRRMRIHVGYGLETVLTNPVCNRIIGETMKPHFKKQEFFEGLDAALDGIMATLNH
jgi:uncharacterized protein